MNTSATGHTSLRELRRQAGLTQAGLARKVGTTQSAVARWERGAVAPSLPALLRVAAACGHRVAFVPSGEEVERFVTEEEVARLEANVRLTPAQRLARASTAGNFVLRARKAMVVARDGQQ